MVEKHLSFNDSLGFDLIATIFPVKYFNYLFHDTYVFFLSFSGRNLVGMLIFKY